MLAQYGILDFLTRAPEPEQRRLAARQLFRNIARKDGENEKQSERLVSFITQATAYHPEERPQSLEEVKHILVT